MRPPFHLKLLIIFRNHIGWPFRALIKCPYSIVMGIAQCPCITRLDPDVICILFPADPPEISCSCRFKFGSSFIAIRQANCHLDHAGPFILNYALSGIVFSVIAIRLIRRKGAPVLTATISRTRAGSQNRNDHTRKEHQLKGPAFLMFSPLPCFYLL